MTDVTGGGATAGGPGGASTSGARTTTGAASTGTGGTTENRSFGDVGASDVQGGPEATLSQATGPTAAGRSAGATGGGRSTEELERDSVLVHGIDMAEQRAREAREWAQHRSESLRETVLMHPFGACAAAFGVGMIFGLLMRR